jgi:hypothetical protein
MAWILKRKLYWYPFWHTSPTHSRPQFWAPTATGAWECAGKVNPPFHCPYLCSHRTCKRGMMQPHPCTHTGGPEGGFSPPSPSFCTHLVHAQRGACVGGFSPSPLHMPPPPLTHKGMCKVHPALFSPSCFYSHSLCSACAWVSKGAGYH